MTMQWQCNDNAMTMQWHWVANPSPRSADNTESCGPAFKGTASLEVTAMDSEDVFSLHNPKPGFDLLDPSPLLCSIPHFINNASTSRNHYNGICEIEELHNPKDPLLSFDQVKHHIWWLSGVVLIEHNMCPNSCVAYTGPYDDKLGCCPQCTTPRHFPGTTRPQKWFSTIPIRPIIQPLYGSCELAEHMHYLKRKLAKNLAYVRAHGGRLSRYNDTACGRDLLAAWDSESFGCSDIALQFFIDGAQLRPDQPSEAWVFLWVIHNLPLSMQYKKDFVIPGATAPRPNRPGDLNSFLFPSLFHVAALLPQDIRHVHKYCHSLLYPMCHLWHCWQSSKGCNVGNGWPWG